MVVRARGAGGWQAAGEAREKGGWRENSPARCPPSHSLTARTPLSLPSAFKGVHRSLGTHISKVRSATLDTWLPSQVAWAGRMGNARGAAFWEARLPPGFVRPVEGDMGALSAFIGAKYR